MIELFQESRGENREKMMSMDFCCV